MMNPKLLADDRYQHAAEVVRQLAPQLEPPVVYDIGAGSLPMKHLVERAGLRYTGFDIAPAAPEVVRWNLNEPCPLPGAQAGLVLLLEVAEHLLNLGLAIHHISDVIAPGGYLLLTTPNPRWSRSRLHALVTGFPSYFTQSDLTLNGHVFPVWPHVMEHILSGAHFVVEDYSLLKAPTAWPPFSLNLRYPLRLGHAILNKLIDLRDPSAAGPAYAVLARRAP
jgi:hypothetical protein